MQERDNCQLSERALLLALLAMQIELFLLFLLDNVMSPSLTSANKFDNRVQRSAIVSWCVCECLRAAQAMQINNYFECTHIRIHIKAIMPACSCIKRVKKQKKVIIIYY